MVLDAIVAAGFTKDSFTEKKKINLTFSMPSLSFVV